MILFILMQRGSLQPAQPANFGVSEIILTVRALLRVPIRVLRLS